jgi:hypothetical protein
MQFSLISWRKSFVGAKPATWHWDGERFFEKKDVGSGLVRNIRFQLRNVRIGFLVMCERELSGESA